MKPEELKDEKQEGRLEATRENILELLEVLGPVPEQLRNQLEGLEELGDLKILLRLAAKANSIQVFEEEAQKYLQSSPIGLK